MTDASKESASDCHHTAATAKSLKFPHDSEISFDELQPPDKPRLWNATNKFDKLVVHAENQENYVQYLIHEIIQAIPAHHFARGGIQCNEGETCSADSSD